MNIHRVYKVFTKNSYYKIRVNPLLTKEIMLVCRLQGVFFTAKSGECKEKER